MKLTYFGHSALLLEAASERLAQPDKTRRCRERAAAAWAKLESALHQNSNPKNQPEPPARATRTVPNIPMTMRRETIDR